MARVVLLYRHQKGDMRALLLIFWVLLTTALASEGDYNLAGYATLTIIAIFVLLYVLSSKTRNKEVKMTSVPEKVAEPLSIDNLVRDLCAEIGKPAPGNWIASFLGSRKITLKKDRIDALVSYMETFQKVNQSATVARAELKATPVILEMLVRGNIQRAQHEIDMQMAEHQNRLHEIKDTMDARKLQLARLENELAMAKASHEAEISAIQAKINDKCSDSALKTAIAGRISNTDMSGTDIAAIITALKSVDTGSTGIAEDFEELKRKMEKHNVEMAYKMAEVDSLRAEAEKKKAQADLERFNVQDTMNAYSR